MDEPPLGIVVDAKEHKRGLWIKAELPKDDTFVAGRVVPQLKRRGLKGMSIGYKILEREQRGDTRYLEADPPLRGLGRQHPDEPARRGREREVLRPNAT